MDLTDEELLATKEKGLYDMELQEEKLIKELKIILTDANLTSDWRKTIVDTIKILGGEL